MSSIFLLETTASTVNGSINETLSFLATGTITGSDSDQYGPSYFNFKVTQTPTKSNVLKPKDIPNSGSEGWLGLASQGANITGLYHFDFSTINDSSGKFLDGIMSGSFTGSSGSYEGSQALLLTNPNNYVSFSSMNAQFLGAKDSYSVVFWLNWFGEDETLGSSYGESQRIIDMSSSNGNYQVFVTPNEPGEHGTSVVLRRDQDTFKTSISSSLETNTWKHISFVFDVFNSGLCKLYIDGQLEASSSIGGDMIGDKQFNTLLIGSPINSGSNLSGAIHELAFFNYILQDYEVERIYSEQTTGLGYDSFLINFIGPNISAITASLTPDVESFQPYTLSMQGFSENLFNGNIISSSILYFTGFAPVTYDFNESKACSSVTSDYSIRTYSSCSLSNQWKRDSKFVPFSKGIRGPANIRLRRNAYSSSLD